MGHVSACHSEYRHPFLVKREQQNNIGYIIVSSDRGLCGSLNQNLFKEVLLKINQHKSNTIKYCLIGRKATSFFGRDSANIMGQKCGLSDHPDLQDILGVIQLMLDAYINKEVDKVYICYNKFVSTMHQQPLISQLIPLPPIEFDNDTKYWDYIYEPDSRQILDLLLKRYIESLVHQAVVENIACEHAARMVAMKNATDNAEDIISALQLRYNKARQAVITQELAEIIGGAGAV